MFGRIEIISGHSVGGKGIGLGSVGGQILKGVALLGVEHLMLQIMGNAGRGIQPLSLQTKAGIHATVAGGEKGIFLGKAASGHNADLKSVGQSLPVHRFSNALIE